MKINTGDICTEVAADANELVFKVDDEDQGFIFEMLRSKIYSDPIAAICREISANARDANREAKKENTPITVGFHEDHPMNGDSSIHVFFKDSGPGISVDRMANVFCKYAKSTKRDDNEQTGGFGLGAKTPFAYADAFTVITNVSGIKYTYTAYIDESRRGKIVKLDETATDEENGTTIMVPMQPYDRRKFERELVKYTALWSVRPVYDGFMYESTTASYLPTAPDRLIETKDGHKVYIVESNNQFFSTAHCIIVDGMPYACDINQIAAYKEFSNNHSVNGQQFVLIADTGEVDLSVNRETLQYTTSTIEFLEGIIKDVHSTMILMVEDYVKTAGSYLEACVKAYCVINNKTNITGADGKNLTGMALTAMAWLKRFAPNDVIKLFKYKGKDVNITPRGMNNMKFLLCYMNDNGNVAYRAVNFSITYFYKRRIFMLDTKTKSVERSTRMLKEVGSVGEFILIVDSKPVWQKGLSDARIAELETQWKMDLQLDREEFESFEIPVMPYSSIPIVQKQRSAAGQAQPIISVSVRDFKMLRRGSAKEMLIAGSMRVRRGFGPVDADGNDITHKYAYLETADLNKVEELTMLKSRMAHFLSEYYGIRLVVVPKRLTGHFKECIDLDSAVQAIETGTLQKIANALEIVSIAKSVSDFGLDRLKLNDKEVLDEMKRLMRHAMRYHKSRMLSTMKDYDTLQTLLDHYKVTHKVGYESVVSYMDDFYKKYPLLSEVSSIKYKSNLKNVNDYIRLVDEDSARSRHLPVVMSVMNQAIPVDSKLVHAVA